MNDELIEVFCAVDSIMGLTEASAWFFYYLSRINSRLHFQFEFMALPILLLRAAKGNYGVNGFYERSHFLFFNNPLFVDKAVKEPTRYHGNSWIRAFKACCSKGSAARIEPLPWERHRMAKLIGSFAGDRFQIKIVPLRFLAKVETALNYWRFKGTSQIVIV